jgi:hypothetical protein
MKLLLSMSYYFSILVSCNTIESVKKSRITGPDDNISQITMTPSLVKASSTMPETDEVQVRRHQGSCQSKCCANIVNYISVFSTYSKNPRYSKYCYGEDTTDESRI